jgi:hypothetical protein
MGKKSTEHLGECCTRREGRRIGLAAGIEAKFGEPVSVDTRDGVSSAVTPRWGCSALSGVLLSFLFDDERWP